MLRCTLPTVQAHTGNRRKLQQLKAKMLARSLQLQLQLPTLPPVQSSSRTNGRDHRATATTARFPLPKGITITPPYALPFGITMFIFISWIFSIQARPCLTMKSPRDRLELEATRATPAWRGFFPELQERKNALPSHKEMRSKSPWLGTYQHTNSVHPNPIIACLPCPDQ